MKEESFLKKERDEVDRALSRLLKERAAGSGKRLFDMQRYSFGFLDESLRRKSTPTGKRLRSALCLYLAEGYGAKGAMRDAALALELFHNTTLIYDDIQDDDAYRRDRPSVWKAFGIDEALNAAGAGNALASQLLVDIAGNSARGARTTQLLAGAFAATWEGQGFDLTLSHTPLSSATERDYLRMVEKKTVALIRAAVLAPGIAAKVSPQELARLTTFADALGFAYQIANDHASLWGSAAETGKDMHGDIRQKKRTLPVLRAYAQLHGMQKRRLQKLYAPDAPLSRSQIAEVFRLIATTDARSFSCAAIERRAQAARAAAEQLALPQRQREALCQFVRSLVPPG